MEDVKATHTEEEASDRRLHVSLGALLQDWKGAHDRARTYLAALLGNSLGPAALALRAVEAAVHRLSSSAGGDAYAETLGALRRLVMGGNGDSSAEDSGSSFLRWRLARIIDGDRRLLSSMPPLTRGAMVPHWIERRGLRRRLLSSRDQQTGCDEAGAARVGSAVRSYRAARTRRRRTPWVRASRRRRALLGILVLIPSVIATGFMFQVLPHQGQTPLEIAIVIFFAALFGWISIGFWTAVTGFLRLLFRRYRFAITSTGGELSGELDPAARTAIVMPICEEPVDRVFAGLQAIYRSLERIGALSSFDFFVLSDTADPGIWIQEESAWFDWCRAVDGFGKVFYRRRRARVKRKSGNIADFCRRFGRRYRYMITLDADSLMTGETLARLVRLMEAHPDAGLIQTAPVAIQARSAYARIQQFANHVYGPLFAAGMHFWQLGDGQYWGHNAIVRIAPFMEHCSLPRLPGRPPFGGEIMSHDFVEAALLGRAGFSAWLAFDLPGSYEEQPSSLLEDLQRDRRWCQGNLQHLRLVFVEGLFNTHRFLFLNGIFSYVSAMLWFAFLSLGTTEAILEAVREPEYFPAGPSLFPQWPIWHSDWAISLLAITLLILFLPKVLSALLVFFRPRVAQSFGGPIRFLLSILLEIVASSLFAPIRMVFHTKFVLTNLIGRTVTWRSPPRGDHEPGWWEAIRHHGMATIVASLWGASVYWLNPRYFWWLTPIVGALILSVPVSVLASRLRLGDLARAAGLFVTPEETVPPPEVVDLRAALEAARAKQREQLAIARDGFVCGIVDPYVNAIHRALLRNRRSRKPSIRARHRELMERALAEGPEALEAKERRILLLDSDSVDELHRRVWELPVSERARRWGLPDSAL